MDFVTLWSGIAGINCKIFMNVDETLTLEGMARNTASPKTSNIFTSGCKERKGPQVRDGRIWNMVHWDGWWSR